MHRVLFMVSRKTAHFKEESTINISEARMRILQGENLEELARDSHMEIRLLVAERGRCLNILVNDDDWNVRRVVAKHGYRLDKLAHDNDWCVRMEAARDKKMVKYLIRDDNPEVRNVVRETMNRYGIVL